MDGVFSRRISNPCDLSGIGLCVLFDVKLEGKHKSADFADAGIDVPCMVLGHVQCRTPHNRL